MNPAGMKCPRTSENRALALPIRTVPSTARTVPRKLILARVGPCVCDHALHEATGVAAISRGNLNGITAKAALNLQKHGVAFEDAARVFLDSGRLESHDGREDDGEDRWATIGQVHAAALYVVYTVRRDEAIRIVSARKALAHEQSQYREANA